jgi:hypothetical protein
VLTRSPLKNLHLEADNSDRTRLIVQREVFVLLAGPEAQRKFAPKSVRSCHASTDYHVAERLAESINQSYEIASTFLKWQRLVASSS